jgi:hypothetical protein
VFDGFNHLPDLLAEAPRPSPALAVPVILISRVYPPLRSYGGDTAIPTKWFTIKGEAEYFTSSSSTTDEYVLYVVQLEPHTQSIRIAASRSMQPSGRTCRLPT